jgi:L-alanine-DL-glutamate epimerase-like enolase superfamily enzyme
LLGLSAQDLPLTSFTVGIDSLDRMVEKLQAACRHPIIKIKLGTDDDVEIVRTLRRETEAVLRVDANCGWDAKKTIAMSHELHALGVEFIEQPLPAEELDAMEEVYRHSALPLIADENCVVPEDVPELRGRFHGINVKLVKCGGILPALRALELARLLGLKTMLGCMIESSLCITAAAHLGPLADFVDLDGPLLITNDPFRGVEYEGARLRLPQRPGLGVEPRDAEPR